MGRRPAHLDRTTSPRPRRHPRGLQIQHIPPRPGRSPGHRRLTSPGTVTKTRRPLAIRRRRRSSHLLPRPRPETIITPKPGRRLLPTRSNPHIRGIIHTETRRRLTRIPMSDNRINQIRTRQTRRPTTRSAVQVQTRISRIRSEPRSTNICGSLKIRTSQRLTRRQRSISNMTTSTRPRTLRNTMRTRRQWSATSQGCGNSTYPGTHSRHSRPVFLQQTCRSPCRHPPKDAQENGLRVCATSDTQNNIHFTHRPQATPQPRSSLIVAGPLRGEKGEQHQGPGTDNLQDTAGRMIPCHQRLFTMLSLERFPPRF